MGISTDDRAFELTAMKTLSATDVQVQPQSRKASLVRTKKGSCDQPQTIGFPALRTEPKRVKFDPPLSAKWASIDGIWSDNCVVVAVWDSGARLRVRSTDELDEFFLLFTSAVNPVFRRCKRVWRSGEEIEVEYQRKKPSFVLDAQSYDLERDDEPAKSLSR
ncbi:hypothetical protein [Bradyrhizobium commune]|uniref:Uncharacterized protein n=1 Tax=Bradyrhizobium commune TaxID=83627 RepID=A0A7S9H1A3_9BRAD|nr:hypothetical protein [Bradyrhizobium commune]QPF92560.1 hypothetical protein IC761_04505 [Bradyrhizobium commune]